MTKAADISQQRALELIEERGAGRRLFRFYQNQYDPQEPDLPGVYHWQVEFHNAGAENQERMLMAANRVGKTSCAAAEIAIHTTGHYPPWWKGRRFARPTKFWCGGESTEAVRDIIQNALLGGEGQHGTGWIPSKHILDVKYRQAGVSNTVDSIHVRHVSGGISLIGLKSYEQGRAKWQGTSLDGVWCDEEPPLDLYTEALTRILDKRGIMMITFTPLKGASDVVLHYMQPKTRGIWLKNVSWDDAPHLSPEDKERMFQSYPEHERVTRVSGQPMMGTGLVFPIADEDILVDPFQIPDFWPRINGCDFGIDHPGAGAFLAHDRESDTVYLYDCYKSTGQTPVYHAAALRRHGDWIPIAWPHDGLIRDKGSGDVLKDQYRKHGAYMLPNPAAYRDERGSHVEPGLIEMLEYMKTGKFKVFRGPGNQFMEEKRLYHREDGVLVKEKDDIISAARYAFVMRRMARTKPAMVGQEPKFRKPMLGMRKWKGSL